MAKKKEVEEVKKSPKKLSGWIELDENQVKELNAIGIKLVGAKKKTLPNKKKVYYSYLFKEADYPRINEYLGGDQ